MNAQIKLGRIFGIEIGLHYSWFIIALLITLSLVGRFEEWNPGWGKTTIWVTGIATAFFFFVTIIAHELSHAAVAKARNLPVRSITLFALGGVAQIEKEANEPATEFLMALAGPITSAVIGVVLLVLAWALGWNTAGMPETPLVAMLMWLGYINISLAVFNLVPGFPLDGGRVMRGILWWITGDGKLATNIATRLGQIIAFAFIVFGIVGFFFGAGFGGLWIAIIGWFLLEASGATRAQFELGQHLKGVKAGDLLERDCAVVHGSDSLQTFVNDYLLRTGKQCYLVRDNNGIEGIITPDDVAETDRNRWPEMTVEQVMRPLDQLHSVTPDTPVNEALEIMSEDDVNQLPVVLNKRIEGFISRRGVLRLLQMHSALRT